MNGYKGRSVKEITLDAKIENVDQVIEFINKELDAFGCIAKAKTEIDVAVDEIFANISNYAYNPNVGSVTIQIEKLDNPNAATITFIDSGVPFDPLIKKDPNVSLSAEERQVGGLGIFIVKKTMDKVEYEYKNNQNILKITKNI